MNSWHTRVDTTIKRIDMLREHGRPKTAAANVPTRATNRPSTATEGQPASLIDRARAAANAANRPTTAAVTSRPTLHSPGLAIARSLDPLHRFPWEAPPIIRPSTAGLTVTDEEVLPYRLQGSAHFDNDEAILAARNVLRGSQRLRSAILQFWTSAGLRQWDKMSEETYAHVHLRIAKALAPELSEEEAISACKEDWAEDAGNKETIDFDAFANGMFSVVDLWTEEVDELSYTVFANKLFRRVTKIAASRLSAIDGRRALLNRASAGRALSGSTSSKGLLVAGAGGGLPRPSFREYRDLSDIQPLAPIDGDGAGAEVAVSSGPVATVRPATAPVQVEDGPESVRSRARRMYWARPLSPKDKVAPAAEEPAAAPSTSAASSTETPPLPPPPPPVRIHSGDGDDDSSSDDDERVLSRGGLLSRTRVSFSLRRRSPAGWHPEVDGVTSPFATPRTLLRKRATQWRPTTGISPAPLSSASSTSGGDAAEQARPPAPPPLRRGPSTPARPEGGAHSDDEDVAESLLQMDLRGMREAKSRAVKSIEDRRRWQRRRSDAQEADAKAAVSRHVVMDETRKLAFSSSMPALALMTRRGSTGGVVGRAW